MIGHRFQSPPVPDEPIATDVAAELVRLEARGAVRNWIGVPAATTLRMVQKLQAAGLIDTLGGVALKVRFTEAGTRLARRAIENLAAVGRAR